MTPTADAPAQVPLSRAHQRRLRQYYRSAGWPCLDNLELDLLSAGLIEQYRPAESVPMVIRLTSAGLARLAQVLSANRQALDPHQQLVALTAQWLAAAGRLVWCDLRLLAPVNGTWHRVRPDVYSIRRSTRADGVLPAIHEIKVRRADLLGELRHAHKRAAYQAVASELTYVFPAGLAGPEEIPAECGVLVLQEGLLCSLRVAQRRVFEPRLSDWLEMARATPLVSEAQPQIELGDASDAASA